MEVTAAAPPRVAIWVGWRSTLLFRLVHLQFLSEKKSHLMCLSEVRQAIKQGKGKCAWM